MKDIGVFVSENFQFFEVTFSIYLNRSVFVMVNMLDLTVIFVVPTTTCIYMLL